MPDEEAFEHVTLTPALEGRRVSELRNYADLIWGVAELLRGDYKQADYGKIILPMVVMRRLDQALEATREKVLERAAEFEGTEESGLELVLLNTTRLPYYNRAKISFPQVLDDQANVAKYLKGYIDGYSSLAREVIDKFDFERHIDRLDEANLLYQVIGRTVRVDLHPDKVSNLEMGYLFEELIRRFSEASNETAGEHFTPREVVRLMVNLLLDGDEDALRETGVIRTVFDPACGTGGMLTEAAHHIRALNLGAQVHIYGQELNPESYAICLADMLVKGQAAKIVNGNSLSNDGHAGERFHYGIANPPFGVDWSKVEKDVRKEHSELGFDGRFGPGLPRKSDGQLLFLLHLISHMRDLEGGGSRIAIVFNGSPLFSGGAGAGESEIRRWIIESDYLEAIVALPEQLFYNTGIATYVWLVTNRKKAERVGKVQLIDAREMWAKMRRSLGDKRRYISEEQIDQITALHGGFSESENVKILSNDDFGYRTITIEQPLRARWETGPDTWVDVEEDKALERLELESDRRAVCSALAELADQRFESEDAAIHAIQGAIESALPKVPARLLKTLVARTMVRDPQAKVVLDRKGFPVPDPDLRDTDNVPITRDISDYLAGDVAPHAPGAWCPDGHGRIGYEIPFSRLFYSDVRRETSEEIKTDLRQLEAELRALLNEVLL